MKNLSIFIGAFCVLSGSSVVFAGKTDLSSSSSSSKSREEQLVFNFTQGEGLPFNFPLQLKRLSIHAPSIEHTWSVELPPFLLAGSAGTIFFEGCSAQLLLERVQVGDRLPSQEREGGPLAGVQWILSQSLACQHSGVKILQTKTREEIQWVHHEQKDVKILGQKIGSWNPPLLPRKNVVSYQEEVREEWGPLTLCHTSQKHSFEFPAALFFYGQEYQGGSVPQASLQPEGMDLGEERLGQELPTRLIFKMDTHSSSEVEDVLSGMAQHLREDLRIQVSRENLEGLEERLRPFGWSTADFVEKLLQPHLMGLQAVFQEKLVEVFPQWLRDQTWILEDRYLVSGLFGLQPRANVVQLGLLYDLNHPSEREWILDSR